MNLAVTPLVQQGPLALASGSVSRSGSPSFSNAMVSSDATANVTPALAEVFREHGRYVFRLLRRLGIPDADVDDVFQEVFVVVHRKLPEFNPHGSLRAWVYGICIRRAANYRKRRHGKRELVAEGTVDLPDLARATPLEALDARRSREVLDGILRSLPDQKREVFVLYVIEELSMPEVADALGCPLHTAYSRLYAARKLVEEAIRRTRAQMSRA